MDFRELNKLDWRLHLNNNNNIVDCSAGNRNSGPDASDERHSELPFRQLDCVTGGSTMGTKQKRAPTTLRQAVVPDDGEDEAGGGGEARARECTATAVAAEGVNKLGSGAYSDLDLDVAGYGLNAAALSPTDAATGGLSSSRTSMNNSTGNLSYASDNFYGDDLILLDDDDGDAEDISINSDDCVYAYRGDGIDFDIDLETTAISRGGRHRLDLNRGPVSTGGCSSTIGVEDETEFLEMDFEPDPSSELEYVAGAQDLGVLPHANLLLMQRDLSQISGIGGTTPTQGRQLFSSPIDDFPQEDIRHQQKQRLSKKFARISLNLDQIKDAGNMGNGVDIDLNESMGDGTDKDVESPGCGQSIKSALAHSLPNTLYTGPSFSRSTSEPSEHPEPKLTGAKPKRLSHSSSVMSKSSSSSRSRRSQPSTSIDERCYSCTDFRPTSVSSCQQQQCGAGPGQDQITPMLVAAAAVVAMASSSSCISHFDLSSNEDNCLDCLEKEFLANTIGKVLDPTTCPKCRKQAGGRGSSLSLYARAEQTRCRSGSPGFFDGGMFAGWHSTSAAGTVNGPSLDLAFNQRFILCDNNFSGIQLPKQSFSTESLVARLSTENICEVEPLVQALEKLHVTYDKELIRGYFEQLAVRRQANSRVNLRQLLMQASKQQGNHRKLKRLIELVTQKQLIVQFKRRDEGNSQLVPIKVTDILDAWERYRDLSILRQLDKRFHCVNVIGKVGHIVRQASVSSSTSPQAASTSSCTRRALPEFLMIPQYYESGELTLIRKC
ncbi:uncharacterized protein LOC108093007 [Drosophila ficusphila]|uniref:uncharacterized protein LOC108093007 n=1 Tax=Drosophila ficusphila TaxID=30025 RepID=UPI0007E77FF0|nr:uncharacterized protein LOC108093007 [Drosophila ficusphila]